MMLLSIFSFLLECTYRVLALRVAWIDSRTFRIPNSHLVLLIQLDILYFVLFRPWHRLELVAISIICVAIFYVTLIAIAIAIFDKPSMGMGDVKLLMVLSGHLVLTHDQSWPFLIARVVNLQIVSWSFASFYALAMWICHKRSRYAFAPSIFLALNIAPLIG